MNISSANPAKIELHLHLEGAAPPAFIRGLAKEKRIDIGGIFDAQGNYKFTDFWDFLRVYEAATEPLKSPEDYHRLTLAVLEESAKSGVIYCETFLSPDFCGGRDVGAWREYLLAIREAADIAEAQMGITLRGIVTPIRHFGPEKARETIQTFRDYDDDLIDRQQAIYDDEARMIESAQSAIAELESLFDEDIDEARRLDLKLYRMSKE